MSNFISRIFKRNSQLLVREEYQEVLTLLDKLDGAGEESHKDKPSSFWLWRILKAAHEWVDNKAAVAANSNRVFFYTFLLECIGITLSSFFLPSISIWPPLAATWFLAGTYLFQGFKSVFLGDKNDEVFYEITTPQGLHSFVGDRVKTTIQKYKDRVLSTDSEFAARLAGREQELDKIKLLIEKLRQFEKEDEVYTNQRIVYLEQIAGKIKEDIESLQFAKAEILEKLNQFATRIPVFNKILDRLSIDQEIELIGDNVQTEVFRDETRAFVAKEMASIRRDGLILIRALEKTVMLTTNCRNSENVLDESWEDVAEISFQIEKSL